MYCFGRFAQRGSRVCAAMESSKWQPVGAAALAIVACFVFMEAQNATSVKEDGAVGKVRSSFAAKRSGPVRVGV